MKRIKHSKYKNTGILFELLVRQITIEVLNNTPNKCAQRILKEYFKPTTELSKELRLYQLLLKEKYNSENRAEKFIEMIIDEHFRKIDRNKILKEKYNLVKEIKNHFSEDKFFSSNINNYREIASVYKLFEANHVDHYDVKDVFNSRYTIVEHVMSNLAPSTDIKRENEAINEYSTQEKDLRLLSYKLLIEKFNKKYNGLSNKQKEIVRNYINNVSNTTDFSSYIINEKKELTTKFKKLLKLVDDKVTEIKLKEVIHLIDGIKPTKKKVPDNYISTLMVSYELLSELTRQIKSDCNGK